jgi:ubiquinone/menaquinone biosynthesis C-methylase UbiE
VPPRARPPRAPERQAAADAAPSAEARFRHLDAYRVEREWKRFEGTPQRELLRTLRERFLDRNAPGVEGPVLEVGPGPGRFTPRLASSGRAVVLLDLSRPMLERARVRLESEGGQGGPLHFVEGNGRFPPLRERRFAGAVLLGNVLGFATSDAEELLQRVARVIRPGGTLLLEIAPGPGEYSRYLHRLPLTALGRLLRAPPSAILPRVLREGFASAETVKRAGKRFRRIGQDEVARLLDSLAFRLIETISIAPCLGSDPARLNTLEIGGSAWGRLLDLEEQAGRPPERWAGAATLLLAARQEVGAGDGAP